MKGYFLSIWPLVKWALPFASRISQDESVLSGWSVGFPS